MITSGLEATHYFFTNEAKRAFLLRCIVFYDVNFTISPLDRHITAEFTKGFSMKTSLINILCL